MSITFTGRPHPVSLERLADELDTLQAFVLQGLEELAAIRKLLSAERTSSSATAERVEGRRDTEEVGHG